MEKRELVYLHTFNVVKYLNRNDKSKSWLAKKLRITPCYMSLLLSQKKNPSAKLRSRITPVLKLSWDDTFIIRLGIRK